MKYWLTKNEELWSERFWNADASDSGRAMSAHVLVIRRACASMDISWRVVLRATLHNHPRWRSNCDSVSQWKSSHVVSGVQRQIDAVELNLNLRCLHQATIQKITSWSLQQ